MYELVFPRIMHASVNCAAPVYNFGCTVQIRKEIVVAVRHCLSAQEFRSEFLTLLNVFLDERALLGDITIDTESMRALRISVLADLVHNVRNELTADQITSIVTVFTNNIHDASLSLSIQVRFVMCHC